MNPQMCFEFVVKLSMCAPFVDCMQAKSDVRLQNHIRWRHNLTMLMRKRSSTFVINENIEVNIITTLKSIKSSVIQ